MQTYSEQSTQTRLPLFLLLTASISSITISKLTQINVIVCRQVASHNATCAISLWPKVVEQRVVECKPLVRLFFLNRKTNQALKPAVPLMSTRGRLQKWVSPHGHVKMTNLTAVNKSSQPAIKYSFGLHQYFHLQQLQWVNLCNYSQRRNNSGLWDSGI